ncbi:MAG: SelB C-terminal domain-containing protein [candidate division Zixibacteria bacterium]|nr:SelB C-terminal domain-containing protein [candidate division Zixibacteria bacterium]
MTLNILVERGKLARTAGKYHLPGRELSVSGTVKSEAERILKDISAGGFSPPLTSVLVKNGKTSRDALGYLLNTNKIMRVSSDVVLESAVWSKALEAIVGILEKGEELTVAVLRNELNTSRKYALPILEETDRLRITTRIDDKRVKGPEFDSALLKV